MFSPRLLQVSRQLRPYVCAFCSASRSLRPRTRFLSATVPCLKSKKNADRTTNGHEKSSSTVADAAKKQDVQEATQLKATKSRRKRRRTQQGHPKTYRIRKIKSQSADKSKEPSTTVREKDQPEEYKSLKEALLEKKPKKSKKRRTPTENLLIEVLSPDDLTFEPIEHAIPPVPRLSHGLDRVLFNPGVYRLQDPRSRVYNFDPYLEKIMPAAEFDFDSLSEYKTSSKDEDLLAMTRKLGTKFTGSTSSMSGVLQHFHFLLSNFRELNHSMLSRKYPESSTKFSKITRGPSAIFLRWKHGLYAIDADKSFDEPNIMSWLGHSMEKLLTNSRTEFERYRRSTPESAPNEDESGKCFHYSRSGNFLVRSQLDAQDSRLPGTGIFDLKTRAVVSIRMDHTEYETGSGYQIRFDQGEWESYEREFYDMTRATMLKYSLQVRMGRMDGIFVAYHNIERMFGFQYLSLPDMDNVLHGQTDTCLGDQEFRLSLRLLDELLQRATQKFPETSIRLHFETREPTKVGDVPYMYVFAEPVTEEQADQIQNSKSEIRKEFERNVIGVKRDDPDMQAEWQDIQDRVDEEVVEDELKSNNVDADTSVDSEAGISGSATEEHLMDEDNEATIEEDRQDDAEATPKRSSSDDPMMGWTLIVRNRVNGAYIDRPENLTPSDNWSLEYHIKEISEPSSRKTYEQLKQRRKKLIGADREERTQSLQQYRDIIKEFSRSGRRWRETQDKIDAQIGQRVYRPLGPGAEELLRQESGA